MTKHYIYTDGELLCNKPRVETDELVIAPSTLDNNQYQPELCAICWCVCLSILAENNPIEKEQSYAKV